MCLLIPDRGHKIDQNTDNNKVQLSGPMSFIRLTYRNMSGELIVRPKMTQRQLHR